MSSISGEELLAIHGLAADAENYAITCRANIDRLTKDYLAQQVEIVQMKAQNAELLAALKEAAAYTRHRDYDWDLYFIRHVQQLIDKAGDV